MACLWANRQLNSVSKPGAAIMLMRLLPRFRSRDTPWSRFPDPSENQHAVAIREEAVARFNCVLVSRHGKFGPGERADEQEETRARQVKVGQHCAHAVELRSAGARMNKQVR